jgi:glycosyltransferase involved in cell wall biosynthesis
VPIATLEAEAATATRAGLGLPEDVPVVLQVGVFRAEKNQGGALEAFAAVREKVPGAVLVFAGEGKTRSEVEAHAAELAAEEWAIFLGSRNDVPALMSVADLVLLPSLADAMPMTILESMALGVPIVASAVGDIPAMLEGGAGVLVPPGDLDRLAAEIVALLGDEARRRAVGDAGREAARAFDSAAMVSSYEAVFEAVSERRTVAA